MTNLNGWKQLCAVLVLCAGSAIAAPSQTFSILVQFNGTDGAFPVGSLVQGPDGEFYGATFEGGGQGCNGLGCGTVFKVSASSKLTTLYTFCSQPNCADGQNPYAGLVLATDGNFYGTTQAGGDLGFGTVFKVSTAGELTTLHSFSSNDGAAPEAALVQAIDGNLYGTTALGGANGGGTIFKVTAGGTFNTLYNFCAEANCADGSVPLGALVQAGDGNLYGTTEKGGAHRYYGTVFKVSLGGKLTTLRSFNYADGAYPYAGLLQASDGNFYGTTEGGGTDGAGTIFELTPGGALSTLHSFDNTDGTAPVAPLVQATDGNFYGTASEGTLVQYGNLFEITPTGTLTVLNTFGQGDGGAPAGLLQATNGTFYGITEILGVNGGGTVYSLDTGLGPFVTFVQPAGKVGHTAEILGQGFTGATGVSFNNVPADFTVVSHALIRATIPAGATTGLVTVDTPTGTLTSNVPFRVLP